MKSFQAQTHYEVLEISVSASADEVKSAYARLSRLYADDQVVLYGMVDGGRAAALRARLREAFDVLADDAQRDRYDVSLGLPPRELPPVPPARPRASAPAGGWGTFAWVTPSAPTPSAPSGPVAFTVPAPATVVSPPQVPPAVSWATAPSAPRQPAPASAVAQPAPLEVTAKAPVDVSVPLPPPTAPPPVPLPPVMERAPAPPPAPPPAAPRTEAPVAEAPVTVPPPVSTPVATSIVVEAPEVQVPATVAPDAPAPVQLEAGAVPSPEAPPEDDVPRLGEDVEVSIAPLRTNSREFRLETRPKPYEVPPGVEFNGDLLRQVRMARGLSLAQLAERTRIGVKHLENVEGDRYDVLPAGVYLRGILMNLSRELGLDGLRVSKSYLTFVDAHRSKG